MSSSPPEAALISLPPELLAYISSYIYSIDRLTCVQLIHPVFRDALRTQIHAALNLSEMPFRFQNWTDNDVRVIYSNFYVSHLFLQRVLDLDMIEMFDEKLKDSATCIEVTIWSPSFYQRLTRIIREFEHVTTWTLDFHLNKENQVYDFLEGIAQRTQHLSMWMSNELPLMTFPPFHRLKSLKLNSVMIHSLQSFPQLEYFHGSISPHCQITPATRDRLKEVVLHFNEFSRHTFDHFFKVLGEKFVEIVLLRIFVSEEDAEFIFNLIRQSKLQKLNLIVSNLLTVLPQSRMKEFVMPNIQAVQSHENAFPDVLLRVWHLFPNIHSVQISFSLSKAKNWKDILRDRNNLLIAEGKHYGGEFHDIILSQFNEIERHFRIFIASKGLSTTKLRNILDKSSILPVFHMYCYRRFWFQNRDSQEEG
mmetsp:Transcript_7682/g.28810  ORF Transcript_7682/g.28810 Transcript_7682/m.28810 type:complete len:421 (-) Transcript_7682:496-1758(-)